MKSIVITFALFCGVASAGPMNCDALVKIAEYAYNNPYSPSLPYYREAAGFDVSERLLLKAHNLFVDMGRSGLTLDEVLMVTKSGCEKGNRDRGEK